MKKVLIMQPQMRVGGVEKVLLTILKYINKDKFDITLLLLNKCEVWDDLIPKEVKVRYIFNKHPSEFGPINNRIYKYGRMIVPKWFIRKFIIKEKYDVCISFHEPMIYFLRGSMGKKIAWIHADYSTVKTLPEIKQLKKQNGILGKYIWNRRLKVYDICDEIICVAKSAKEGFIEKFNYNEDKVRYKYNPNDVKEIVAKSNENIDYELSDFINFCSVGRLSYEKSLQRIINASKKLKSEGFKFKYFIIGDGEERYKLEQLVNQYNLQDYIVFVGYENNPYKYISKCDFLASSSLYEALSTVATESIILGVPVVTTDCSGMKEIFGDTKAGLIVKNDDESMYYGIKQVMSDKVLLNNMKEAAKLRSTNFDINKLMRDIEELIQG